MKSSPVRKEKKSKISEDQNYLFIILVLSFTLVAFIRFRLLSFPLERDEGEYAYFGQLLLQGIPPYKLAYNLKFPGCYGMYAMFLAVFGQTPWGIHLGSLLIALGNMVFIYFIARKLFNKVVATVAVPVTGLLMVSPSVLGQAAHANHFVTFFMLAGIWALIKAFDHDRPGTYFLAGILIGMAYIMKQSGFMFAFMGALLIILRFLLIRPGQIGRHLFFLILYLAGAVIPLLVVFLIMWWSGVFSKFWFWTMIYPSVYNSRIPLSGLWTSFYSNFSMVCSSFTVLWIIAALGIPAIFLYPGKKKEKFFLGAFLVFAFLSAVPGFYFRNHYFLPLLPAVGILCGLFLDLISLKLSPYFRQIRKLALVIILLITFFGLYAEKEYFFTGRPEELCRNIYAGNPFTEAIPVSRYIEINSNPDDKIFVLGSEPEIYFYSQRKSASGYIYMYDFGFRHRYLEEMRKEMEKEVESSHPKFIVFIKSKLSWLAKKEYIDSILNWSARYLQEKKFVCTGVADILYPGPTRYAWDDEIRTYRKQSDNFILVFRRND